jgi:hypothetical protein
MTHPFEIQEKLRKQYLERLSLRMKKLRKELVDRNWPVLKTECRQLKTSESFGFSEISQLAVRAEASIPAGDISRAKGLPEARQAIDELITAIDSVLTK